jgi:ribosomal protein L11 methyltransferase
MSDHDENWYRLIILVQAARGQQAAALLWEHGAEGVEIHDADTYADDQSVAPVPDGTSRLVAYFQEASPRQAGRMEHAIVNALNRGDIPPLSVQCGAFTDQSWKTSWKDFFEPTQISERSIVGPPWEDFEAPEGGTKIVIEPGMAFGTGTHETTQLCGAKIDRLLGESQRSGDGERTLSLLDVGCGSAILSMIAARLGAAPVVGIDVDPTAVEVARKNLAVNQLVGEVDLSTRPLAMIEETFDVVVANILTHILLSLRDDLLARVKPGGTLLLSGITEAQIDSIREAFVTEEFTEVDLAQNGEWVCFELRRAEA